VTTTTTTMMNGRVDGWPDEASSFASDEVGGGGGGRDGRGIGVSSGETSVRRDQESIDSDDQSKSAL
jgi:hypothetical protein